VIGLADVPMAGDSVNIVSDEKTAKDVADIRVNAQRLAATAKSSAATLDELLTRIRTEGTIEVSVIIKGDTQGSVEAIAEAVNKLNTDKVKNRIALKGAGGITESDIMLAAATSAVIIGFNVRAGRGLDDVAQKHGVTIKYFSVIYEIVDAMKAVMAGRLPPIQKEVVVGHAEVRNPISIPKIGTIAGSAVLDGKITRNSHLRLIRADVVIYSGRIGSLRRFKDDVREVAQGYECGIGIDGYQDLRVGDVIEAFVIEEVAPTL
jgi:translation initiation factor IF-2